MSAILEVCAFTIQSCLLAEKAGAQRVELCDNPLEGGTTPSYGTIRSVRDRISIELYPIIRPRSMNYYYDKEEWAILEADIQICKSLGCEGISIGVQQIDGRIDANGMKRICDLAYPMKVTCNRAFDAVPDPFEALETIINAGCIRVLSSGLAASAPEGTSLLAKLVQQSAGRISIMPGAGINATNLKQLRQDTGAHEFHASARKAVTNPMLFSNPLVSDAGNMYVAAEDELKRLVAILAE
jgi:copper homeostasis protein